MPKRVLAKLLLPLMLVSVGSLVLHYFWDWDGLLVNLATEVLGILVTVAYVDWVLRRHQDEQWAGTQSRVQERLQQHVNATVSGLRSVFGIPFETLDQAEMWSNDVDRAQRELMRFCEQSMEPRLREFVGGLDRSGWQRLGQHLQDVGRRANALGDRFGAQLTPSRIELLIDIENSAQRAQYLLSTFPEIAGAPDDELPETSRVPAHVIRDQGYDSAAKELAVVLAASRRLVDA